MANKRNKKHKDAKLFYEGYKGGKVCYKTFISRVYISHMDFEEAIKPGYLSIGGNRGRNQWLVDFWKSYKGEKCTYSTLYGRYIRSGFPREEKELLKIIKPNIAVPRKDKKMYVRTISEKVETPESYRIIDVKLSPEEFRVYARAYERMISDLSDRYYSDTKNNHSLLQELESLEKEYESFIKLQK